MGYFGCLKGKVFISLLVVSALICGLTFWPVLTLAQIPPTVRVGIITSNIYSQYRNASAVTFSVKGSYQAVDLAAIPGGDLIGTAAEGESWQVRFLPGGIEIYKNLQSLKVTTGPVVFRETEHSPSNQVCLENYETNSSTVSLRKYYRGNMEFRSNGAGITVINELPAEEYLYGVVPREMSNSWPLEALKAQAVAARTYMVASYNKRIVEGFNLLDTKYDQVYGGVNSEGAHATTAVQETTGQIILYDGKPIDAKYHSTSGGHTEDYENVWGVNHRPYLKGKEDPYSTTNGLANWTYTVSLDEVKNKLTESGSPIGQVSSFQLEKYPSGRVKTVMITDINGNTITKSGSEFGKLFNPEFYTYVNNMSFMSIFFETGMDQVVVPGYSVLTGTGQQVPVAGTALHGIFDDGRTGLLNSPEAEFYVLDAAGTSSCSKAPAGSVVFTGHGWGHGVGMSQWGAYAMAVQGKSYEEILTFYYNGVQISNQ